MVKKDREQGGSAIFKKVSTSYGSTEHHELVRLSRNELLLRYSSERFDVLAQNYCDAANRLASTFTGRGSDDGMLLPLLMLYRQAYELQLKSTIKALLELRKKYDIGDISDESFQDPEAYIGKFKHNFHQLLNAVENNFRTFPTGAPVSNSIRTVVMAFHQADQNGAAFRYPHLLPEDVDVLNLSHLVRYLNKPFQELSGLVDYLSDLYENGDGFQGAP